MKHITFKEHLFLSEARREDLKYTEKQVKNVLDRVSTTLEGSESANMTKLAKRYARLEVSLKAMKEKHDELNSRLKGDVGNLFNAEDEILTRVVNTAQFTLTMAKELKKADSKEVDYTSLIAALSALIPTELQSRVEALTEQYTKLVPAKTPPKKLSVSKELAEGLIDNLVKLKDWAARMLKQVTSWGTRYDSKLDALKQKFEAIK